jgi:hypothetical protein
MNRFVALVLALSLSFASVVRADALERLRAEGQLTDETRLVLAQSVWGESGIYPWIRESATDRCASPELGCHVNVDWTLIPWVLARRWETLRNQGKVLSFGSLIRSYSSPVKPSLRSERHRLIQINRGNVDEVRRIEFRRFLSAVTWIRTDFAELRNRFNRTADPDLYRYGWGMIRDTIDRWIAGEVPDQCPAAQHWNYRGAPLTWDRLSPIDCGPTTNQYFEVRSN